jgi:hypothetical protein
MRRVILGGFVLILLASPAFSQNPSTVEMSPKAIIGGFLVSDGFRAFAEDTINRLEPPLLQNECPHMTILGNTNQYISVKDVSLIGQSPNLLVANGAWVSVIDFDRCGTKVRRRTFMKADEKGHIASARLLPGGFRGDLKLERDATIIVEPALLIAAACSDNKQKIMRDIVVKEIKPNGAWIELWTASVCGKDVSVEVLYSPAPDGIVVSTNARKP